MSSTRSAIRLRHRIVAVGVTASLALSGAVLTAGPAIAADPLLPDPKLGVCVHSGLVDLVGSVLAGVLEALGLSDVADSLTGTLSCSSENVIDLTGLDEFTKLTGLDLSGNAITDVTDLAGLVDLNTLNLNGNGITDLSSLSGLTDTVISATGQVIDLGDQEAGVPIVLPVLKGLSGALAPITDASGGVVGEIDTVTGTVTFLSAGIGELTFALGNFTGTILATLSNSSFSSSAGAAITGSNEFGSTLAVETSGWPEGTTFTYAWSRGGVTTPTYLLDASDIGERLTVSITGSKDGFNNKTVLSDQTNTIRKATISLAPTPTISGTTTVGSTLTVAPGTWSAGVALTYQWFRAGSPVAASKATSYVLGVSDIGKAITVSVQGTRENYTTLTRTSAATALITATTIVPDSSKPGTTTTTTTVTTGTSAAVLKKFAKTYAPKVSGTAKVGKKLTAKTAKWSKKVKFTYQWKANGKSIAKAESKTWKVTKKYVGKKITVQVTAKLPGYTPAIKTSKSTKKVRV